MNTQPSQSPGRWLPYFMRRQLSNEHSYLLSGIFFVIGASIGIVIVLVFFTVTYSPGAIVLTLIPITIGLLGWYYSIRFYNVSFDSDFLYFSRFGRRQKINLETISDVKTSVLPIRIFYLRSYIVTIIYGEFPSKKKIRFLSRGIFRIVGSIGEIPNLDILRSFIKEKKYGR